MDKRRYGGEEEGKLGPWLRDIGTAPRPRGSPSFVSVHMRGQMRGILLTFVHVPHGLTIHG